MPSDGLDERALLDALSYVVIVAGADGTIRYSNAAVSRVLGWEPSEMVGRPITTVIPPAFHDQHLDGFARYLASGESRMLGRGPVRLSALHRDGSEVEIELTLSEQPGIDGERQMVAVIGQILGRRITDQDSRERLMFLARASGALDVSMDFDATLARLARICVPFVADLCAIDVLEGDVLRRVTAAAVDPEKEAVAEELRRQWQLNPERLSPVRRAALLAVRSGEAQFYTESAEPSHGDTVADIEHAELVSRLGVTSGLAVPLKARGHILGAISFGMGESERAFGPRDLTFVEELAARAALALDNARLFTERSYVARRLQDSLMPRNLPDVPGLEVAARYVAAGGLADVGGDFFDVFRWGADEWVVVVGDVCGKGVEAAALTGLVRHALRALALRGGDPTTVLRDLNTVLLEERTGERFCTICLVTLKVTDGVATGLVTTAGHPSPAIVRADGTVDFIGAPGTLIGLLPEVVVDELPLTLHSGDSLVLYTDGVVERRSEEEFYGDDRLALELRRTAGHTADAMVAEIERSVAAFDWHELRDDMAIVAVRVL